MYIFPSKHPINCCYLENNQSNTQSLLLLHLLLIFRGLDSTGNNMMIHSLDFLQFAGPALLGVSIWQYIKLMSYDPVLEISKFQIPAIIYIIAGVASTLNGIIGCIGGVNERKGAILLVIVSTMIKQRLRFIASKSPNE